MILKYENSEENCKTNSYIYVFLMSITQYIQILFFFLLKFVWFKFLNNPLYKIPRAAIAIRYYLLYNL